MRSMECRNFAVLEFGTCATVANVSPLAVRSQSSWNTGSSCSTSTGPKPCLPPRSWMPSTPRILTRRLYGRSSVHRTEIRPQSSLSVLDSLHGLDAFVVGVLDLAHLGDGVGHGDDLVGGVAAGDDDIGLG